MIPGVLARFLERASVAVAATRDRDLTPSIHWVSGWRLEEDGTTMRCAIGCGVAGEMGASLADNGQIAMTAEIIGSHETYQFKGRLVDTRPIEDADLELHERCRGRFVADVEAQYPGGFEREALLASARPPEIVVRFRIDTVFVQTPGPAAGMRLYPREA